MCEEINLKTFWN